MFQFTYKDLKMVIKCVKDLCFWRWVKVLSGDFYEFKNLVLDFDICPQNIPFSTKVQGYIIGKTYNCDHNERTC